MQLSGKPHFQPHGWLVIWSWKRICFEYRMILTLYDDNRDCRDIDALPTGFFLSNADLIWHNHHARKSYRQLSAFPSVINYTKTNEYICAHERIMYQQGEQDKTYVSSNLSPSLTWKVTGNTPWGFKLSRDGWSNCWEEEDVKTIMFNHRWDHSQYHSQQGFALFSANLN